MLPRRRRRLQLGLVQQLLGDTCMRGRRQEQEQQQQQQRPRRHDPWAHARGNLFCSQRKLIDEVELFTVTPTTSGEQEGLGN